MARDGTHLRVAERRDEAAQGVTLEERVGVQEDEQIVARQIDATPKRLALAGVGLLDQPQVRMLRDESLRDLPGAVLGAVVDDDHLHPSRVVGVQHGAQRGSNDFFLVVGRDDDAQRFRELAVLGDIRRAAG